VPSLKERQSNGFEFETFVVTREAKTSHPREVYKSLADMWSEWYQAYLDSDFPRLIIRFEDTLFHAEKVMQLVTECLGQPLDVPFQYHLGASKTHGNSNGFKDALSIYGRAEGRYNGLTSEDNVYASTAINSSLLELFHYPSISKNVSEAEETEEEMLNRRIAGLVSGFEPCRGKEQLLTILIRAKKDNIGLDDCIALPTWNEVTSLYGAEPVVYGLETCSRYRELISSEGLEPDPRVDGLYNSGTNAFVDLLDLNFRSVQNCSEYNIPGSKHVLLKNRDWAKNATNSTSFPFFPIVLVRDPLRWMTSMVSKKRCRL